MVLKLISYDSVINTKESCLFQLHKEGTTEIENLEDSEFLKKIKLK